MPSFLEQEQGAQTKKNGCDRQDQIANQEN